MKKYAYIICFICIITVFSFFYYIQYKNSGINTGSKFENASDMDSVDLTDNPENTSYKEANEDEDITAMNYENLNFIIRSVNDEIIVYYEDGCTIFLNTGIDASKLDSTSKTILESGIIAEDAQELFNLLETYSS